MDNEHKEPDFRDVSLAGISDEELLKLRFEWYEGYKQILELEELMLKDYDRVPTETEGNWRELRG